MINCLNKVNEILHLLLIFNLWDHIFISGFIILNSVPLEGAQIAVFLGIYKSLFLEFFTCMKLGVALILIFLLDLAGLFVCLFFSPLSLFRASASWETLEWVCSSSSWCYFNSIRQHSTDSLTASLLTSWPNTNYCATDVKTELYISFQVFKLDVVESGDPEPFQGQQIISG